MLKKFLIIILFTSFLLTNEVRAQQELLESQSYTGYIEAQDTYRSAYDNYELKKSEYLKFGTLNSKNEAISATKNLLVARDNVWLSYYTLLTQDLRSEDMSIGNELRNQTAVNILEEANFIAKQKNEAQSADSLERFVEISNTTNQRVVTLETTAFEAIAVISIAKLEYRKDKTNKIINDIESKLGEIDANGDKDTTLARRWLEDAKGEVGEYENSVRLARDALVEIETKTSINSRRSTFAKVQQNLLHAKDSLLKSNNYLGEILTEVKTAD